MISELDALTPRSRINGHMTSTSANHHHHSASPPSFTLKLKDCEVEEGESFDLQCTTQGILRIVHGALRAALIDQCCSEGTMDYMHFVDAQTCICMCNIKHKHIIHVGLCVVFSSMNFFI